MTGVLKAIAGTDRAVTWLRPAFLWLGQLAVIVLGTHLAADRLDDHLLWILHSLALPWPDPGTPVVVAAWSAVVLELWVAIWATYVLWAAIGAEPFDRREWWERRSVASFVRPIFWFPVALAGCWVVGMSAEDLLAPYIGTAAAWIGWTVAALTGWRLAFTGARRVVLGTPVPKARRLGWASAPVLLFVAALALFDALPIWGWLS